MTMVPDEYQKGFNEAFELSNNSLVEMKGKILEYLFNTENHTDKDSKFYISEEYLKQTIEFIETLK